MKVYVGDIWEYNREGEHKSQYKVIKINYNKYLAKLKDLQRGWLVRVINANEFDKVHWRLLKRGVGSTKLGKIFYK